MTRRGSAFRCPPRGDLRQAMTIRVPAIPTDGETKPTWTTLAAGVPCKRVYVRGREVISGDRVVGLGTDMVTFRWRGDVTNRNRFRFPTTSGTDDVLEVLTLGDPDGNREWQVAECNLLEST